ncbi:hypothetical protein RJ639_045390 [Escallonia herrerae]|uniref:6,7-dimethyl-8-ribityllumazine synthase n=1 Tax=Escallonia herrerae TaxID=1293975 RepID=A0AA88WA63_9ASTE|nr:hypothetical protein RJ639_045390 [Escallonia herrerae]
MGNSLRCCLACVLPCGALDLIRIVHLNGYVEEITRPVTAGEVLKNNPNHVLSKPCSQGVSRRILILSPETELKRGSIYFLIPCSSLPEKKKSQKKPAKKVKKCDESAAECDRYLTDIISEKKSVRRDRRTVGLENSVYSRNQHASKDEAFCSQITRWNAGDDFNFKN